MGTKKHKFIFGLIILGGIWLRLVFYTGLYSVDDFKYANHAYESLNPQETIRQDMSLYREYLKTKHKFIVPATKLFFSVYLPVAVLYKFFGVSDWVTMAWPFACSVGKIIVCFFLAIIIFRKIEIGFISACLVAIFPISVIYATRLVPDEITNFFTGLTILLFLKSDSESGVRNSWGYIAGISLGIAYMARAYVLILGLFFLIYAWSRRKILLIRPFSLGFLTVFFIENMLFLYFHFFKGVPFLFRLSAYEQAWLNLHYTNPWELIKIFPRQLFAFNITGIFYYLLAIAFFYLIISRKLKFVLVPFVWFSNIFFCLWFLPIHWKIYMLPVRCPRYIDMMTLPMVLILAYVINLIREKRPPISILVIGIVMVISVWGMMTQIYGPETEKFDADSFRITADVLKVLPSRTVYCDVPTVSYKINYYYRFKLPFIIKRSVTLTPEDRGVHVLIHDFRENPSLDKEGIIRSIKAGEVLGGRTAHLQGEGFDLSKWILLKVIKGRGGPYIYIYHVP